MKTLKMIIVLLIASITITNAQKNHFEIELDPLAYAFGGLSGHVAYTIKNHRIQVGYAQLTLPEFAQSHESITESFKAAPSLKWDYFFGREDASQGFFAGPTVDYLLWTYKNDTDEFKDNQLTLGIRGGYKFNLFKESKALNGLYLTPWIGFSSSVGQGDIQLDNQEYSKRALGIFPTFHLGWSF